MNRTRRLIVLSLAVVLGAGCAEKVPQYGAEMPLSWPGPRRQVWAVAPAINLSGQKAIDPLIQGDLVYQQLQTVNGMTVIPVNRVVEVYASLQIEKVESPEQAALVCELLGCDGLVVPSITAFDPYNPPKFGAALQLFARAGALAKPASVDVRQLVRSAAPDPNDAMLPPEQADFRQVVGMFDAANGTVRQAVLDYATGRNDPMGPLGPKEYLVNMDRYCGFAYFSLIRELINSVGQ